MSTDDFGLPQAISRGFPALSGDLYVSFSRPTGRLRLYVPAHHRGFRLQQEWQHAPSGQVEWVNVPEVSEPRTPGLWRRIINRFRKVNA